jgi:succinyl-diaminopimelate desuccinylase
MEWIERIIRIDTITHKSNEEIVRFLVPLLEETGLKIEEQEVEENGVKFKNLVAFNHTLDAPGLLALNTHLDTVSFGDTADWTKTRGNPFRATRVRDRIYGLGTADVKLDFLCKLWAIRKAQPQRPFALIGTYGEERGLVGATQLLKAKKVKPRFAMVGEPSNLELIYAHKGHLIATVGIDLDVKNVRFLEKPQSKIWKGKAAHSSTPELGDNALMKGLTDVFKRGYGIISLNAGTGTNSVPDRCEAEVVLQQTPATRQLFALVRALEEIARDLKKRRDTRFSPPHSTLSLNLCRTVDGELRLSFDCRSLPDVDTERLKKKLIQSAEGHGFRLIELSYDEPLRGRKNSAFILAAAKALKACGADVVKKTKASSTEAALYNHHGAEAIVFGPGLSVGNVHRPNEYNSLHQMSIATKFYTHLLQMPEGEF